MIRLLYLSQSKKNISAEHLDDILQVSQRNNPVIGITGVLIHGGGLFMQVLEGPEEVVLRKYVHILDDSRHDQSKMIYISRVKDRMFEKWSMGIIKSDMLEFQHITELNAKSIETIDANFFTDIMRDFVRRLNVA
jgi:hypothetical protein